MATHSELATHYQQTLEARRGLTDWDGHDLGEEVDELVVEAKSHMEVAWLKSQTSL